MDVCVRSYSYPVWLLHNGIIFFKYIKLTSFIVGFVLWLVTSPFYGTSVSTGTSVSAQIDVLNALYQHVRFMNVPNSL